MAKILVVDDEKGIRDALDTILSRQGHDVVPAQSVAAGARELEGGQFDAALIDLRLPDGDGRELIPLAVKKNAAVIMISGHASVPLAVEAVKQGAFDFLEKPLDRERILIVLKNAVREKELRLRDEPAMVFRSKKMERLISEAEKFARSNDPVTTAQVADLFRQAEMTDDALALYKKAVELGIQKVNLCTDLTDAGYRNLTAECAKITGRLPASTEVYDSLEAGYRGMLEHYLKLFGGVGVL